jgi:BirA family transcriptional regulator, biotin operon repressor / biotin---[acetyl-CoA-carboxylase] ligase
MATILKLNAINSTNSYLKEWSKENRLVKSKAVVAKNQTNGRGQRQSKWASESGKNLTFSLLYRLDDFSLANQFFLNCAISVGIYKTLYPIIGNTLTIKWPNDIMTGSHKIGGILIENTVRTGFIKKTIIGVGLNVNQTKFKRLPHASSLKLIKNTSYELQPLLKDLIFSIESQLKILENGHLNVFFEAYQKILFGRERRLKFSENKKEFYATIVGVNIKGQLVLALDNGNIKTYNNKEVKFLL